MVNLNNRLDYFGQVVNMAARIQGTPAAATSSSPPRSGGTRVRSSG